MLREAGRGHLSAERVRELFSYDAETGLLTRRVRFGRKFGPGTVTGSLHRTGYIVIGIDNCRYSAHRLIFFLVTGEWPLVCDHINGVKSDNRWCNLRACTPSQNRMNSRTRNDSRSGIKGVRRQGKKWEARLQHGGSYTHLGTFDTKDEAAAAYAAKAKDTFGEFAPARARGAA